MSIDRLEINSVDSLIKCLNFSNISIRSIDADLYIRRIWDVVDKIWEDAKATSFTDHKLTHSYRIMEFFIDFDKLFKWSDYSKLVFTIAALIHDIGMQYEIWRCDSLSKITKDGKLVFPNLIDVTPAIIRENHCELGYSFVYYQIFNLDKIKFDYDLYIDKKYSDLLYQAMYVAFSHSSRSKYFEELRTNNEIWNKYTDKESGYSPRLLAGILRLCDEFDCTYKRIKVERLNASEINQEGRGHWYTCHFITKSKLRFSEDNNSSPKLYISWRAPHNKKEIENDVIRNFIIKNRILKIIEEQKTVREFLRDINEEAESKLSGFDAVLDNKPEPSSVVDLSKEVKTIMLKYTYKGKPISNNKKPIDPFRKDKLDGKIIINLERIRKMLNDWFYECMDPQHHILDTSDHTDVYLNCRDLISYHSYVREIGSFIHEYFSQIGVNIDCVLAIGTSAIPFATNYQIFSNCRSTFTMSAKKIYGDTENDAKDYISTEIVPIVGDSKEILIIDDIISSGDVANAIINKYLKSSDINNIYYLSLFRLGNRKIIRNRKIKKYLWFCHYPWVYYWRENNEEGARCIYCEQKVKAALESQH